MKIAYNKEYPVANSELEKDSIFEYTKRQEDRTEKAIKDGDRVRHPSGDGIKLYEVLQDHTSTELQPQEVNYWYVDIAHRIATDEDGNPTDEYPDWVQPTGYENVYKRGDIVKHDNKIWVLDADTSAYEPGTPHSGWVEREGL